ncbi:hypothetical protein [Nocardia speluncae]|nr:hypothetical protein [Nocardia speluncae]
MRIVVSTRSGSRSRFGLRRAAPVFGMEADVSILAYLLVTVAVFGVLGFVQRMVERL